MASSFNLEMKRSDNKVKSLTEIARIVRRAKAAGKVVVTTNGCFDILHVGHIKNLEWAKRHGDMLIVGVNSDSSARALKGPKRPIVPAAERARVLASLRVVDYVFIFGGKSPIPSFKKIKPSIQVKAASTKKSPAFFTEKKIIEQNGGKVVVAPNTGGKSTSKIIESILKKYRP